MAEKAKRRGGGGKLSRSETVTIRLDPMLNYLADIAARVNRQTKSSFIEMAVRDAVARTALRPQQADVTVWSETREIWDVDEADRFVKLALRYPELLTFEEQVLWKTICQYDYYWDNQKERKLENAHWPRLRGDWENLKLVARGDLSASELSVFSPSDLETALNGAASATMHLSEEEATDAQSKLTDVLGDLANKE